jgi:hypothetical protein
LFARTWLTPDTNQHISCYFSTNYSDSIDPVKEQCVGKRTLMFKRWSTFSTRPNEANFLVVDSPESKEHIPVHYIPFVITRDGYPGFTISSKSYGFEWDFREWTFLYKNTAYALLLVLKKTKPHFGSFATDFVKQVMHMLT